MSTRPEVPSSETVAAHHEQSLEKRVRGRRILWGVLVGFVLLLMLTPFAVYLAWQARGRALLRTEIEAIVASGEPLTTGEMAAWHAVPAGKRDITAIWVAALKPFDGQAFTTLAGTTPIVGTGTSTITPLDQPLAATDEQAMRQFLMQAQPLIAAVYAAADEAGEVRFDRDFRKGIAMLLPEAQQLRAAVRSLQVEFEILAREPALNAAIENLETRFIAGETLRHEPLLISMLVRIAVQCINFTDARRLCDTGKLTDEQLARLQTLVRGIDIHAQLPDAFLGERAWNYHAFHNKIGFTFDPSEKALGEFQRETTHDVSKVKRPEDCAMAVSMLTEMHAAAQEPLPAIFDASKAIEDELLDLRGEKFQINRLRYMLTLMLVPALSSIGKADARGEVQRDMTDAALAIRRFHLRHGKRPDSLADLVPEFLPRIPRDSFDGLPLRFVANDDHLLLYSVGEDRRDDGGKSDDPARTQPDMSLEVKLPAGE